MADIIKDVLAKEREAAASIEKAKADLAADLDKERHSLEQKAQERVSAAQIKYATEIGELREKLQAEQQAREKSLAQSHKKYEKITDERISQVASNVTAALK